MKSYVQTIVNEVKSMIETINTLRDEIKYIRPDNDVRNLNCTYADKVKTSSPHYSTSTQLESQLQETLYELSSMKLITNILKEDPKSLKQSVHLDHNTGSLRTTVKPSYSQDTMASRSPESTHSSLGTSNTSQYIVPTSNRYAVLSNNLGIYCRIMGQVWRFLDGATGDRAMSVRMTSGK